MVAYYPFGAGKDMIFDRTWVAPKAIENEYILTDDTTQIEVWNAYQDDTVTWDTCVGVATTGTTFTYAALPISFGPTDGNTYPLVVDADGPMVQDSSYTLGFSDGSSHEITITGSRVALITLEPTWSDGFSIKYEFYTSLFRAETFGEQRRPLHNVPYCTFTARYHACTTDSQRLLSKIIYGKDKVFAVPVYPEVLIPTSTGIVVGGTEVTLSTDPYYLWFLRNKALYAVLMDWPSQDCEVKYIASIDYVTPSLKFSLGVIKDLPESSTVVYPVMFALLQSTDIKHETDGTLVAELEFREVRGLS